MKVTIPVVGNSILSRLVSLVLYLISIFGGFQAVIGVVGTAEAIIKGNLIGIPIGLLVIAAGIALVKLPYVVYFSIIRYVHFLRIKKEIKEKGYEPILMASAEPALKVYDMAPGRASLAYINSLNPKAAELIKAREKQGRNLDVCDTPALGRGRRIRWTMSYACLAAGIAILGFVYIYNKNYAYSYEEVPYEYEKYEKEMKLDTYAKMKICEAYAIATKKSEQTVKNGQTVISSSLEGVYYCAIDNRGVIGIVFLPVEYMGDGYKEFKYLTFLEKNDDEEDYELELPLWVYGRIEKMPNDFTDSLDADEMLSYEGGYEQYWEDHRQLVSEMNKWLSDYVLLSVNSLKPLTKTVQVGQGIDEDWIGWGILLLIIFVIIRPRKPEDSESKEYDI